VCDQRLSVKDDTVSSAPDNLRCRQAGQVIVLFGLSIFVLIGFVALAIDAGFLMAERRQAQSAADGAAMAADKAYQRNEYADIVPTGVDYAEDNGFDASEVTITPLATYTVNGIDYVMCVQADIEHDVTPFFVGAIYGGAWSVAATAVACTEPEPREYALIALDEDGDGVAATGGAGLVITNGGGTMSNASGDYCGSLEWIQAEGPLDAAGGIDICNNANVESLTPNPSAAPIVDPLDGIDEPDCSGLPVYTSNNPAIPYPDPGGEPDVNVNSSDPLVQRYGPGNYPNGITIRNTHNVTFDPGLYCIGGNGLNLQAGTSQNLNAVGDDVMFYMYGSNSKFDLSGQGVNVNFSNLDGLACGQPACAAEVIIFYSRGRIAAQPEDCSTLMLNGNTVTIGGILYAPCSLIQLEGNGALTISGQVLGASILARGNNNITVNFESSLDVSPAQVYLVE
jgi:hypothetical protein